MFTMRINKAQLRAQLPGIEKCMPDQALFIVQKQIQIAAEATHMIWIRDDLQLILF